MLTHVVLIKLADDAPEERVRDLVAGLRALPDQIPEIGSYTVGRDLGLRDGNHEVGIIATFASADDLAAYIDHPAHQAVVTDLIRPVAVSVSRLQMAGPVEG